MLVVHSSQSQFHTEPVAEQLQTVRDTGPAEL